MEYVKSPSNNPAKRGPKKKELLEKFAHDPYHFINAHMTPLDKRQVDYVKLKCIVAVYEEYRFKRKFGLPPIDQIHRNHRMYLIDLYIGPALKFYLPYIHGPVDSEVARRECQIGALLVALATLLKEPVVQIGIFTDRHMYKFFQGALKHISSDHTPFVDLVGSSIFRVETTVMIQTRNHWINTLFTLDDHCLLWAGLFAREFVKMADDFCTGGEALSSLERLLRRKWKFMSAKGISDGRDFHKSMCEDVARIRTRLDPGNGSLGKAWEIFQKQLDDNGRLLFRNYYGLAPESVEEPKPDNVSHATLIVGRDNIFL